MNTKHKMLLAFLLNLSFSVFEFFGGIISGSYAIMSDALHDLGDALGIGISLIFESKSKKAPDEKYTYGYGAFSLIGALITTIILILGSLFIIINAVKRIICPTPIEYGKMLVFAIIGVVINTVSAFITREKEGANMRAVNLHMLEDVLGWVCVLIGAVIMHFTDFGIIDPLLSVGVSVFIMVHAIKNLKGIFEIFLQKVPSGTSINEIRNNILQTRGIIDVHHIHIWSYDENNTLATMHIVTDENQSEVKQKVRKELSGLGINHVTLEIECANEMCKDKCCSIFETSEHSCTHHHHHH